MIAEWLTEFYKTDNQLIITELSKRYSLSKEEYVNLVNIMIYYYVISGKPDTVEATNFICNEIISHRDEILKHQTRQLFHDCISYFLKVEDNVRNLDRIEKFINQGFVFHSFNPSFLDTINKNGLIGKEKPWDLEEVEQVRKIFWKRNNKNIFGLYQGREETPIFFANNLLSSAYYGLSSPTFFRKFIENNSNYFNVFFNRDFEKAKKSIEELCMGLEEQEKVMVTSFFQKYWDIFATTDLPYVAISTREKLNISHTISEKQSNETQIQYLLRRILDTKNEMLHGNVSRESIEIFSYDTFTIIPYTKEKTYQNMSF